MPDGESGERRGVFHLGVKKGNPEDGYVVSYSQQGGPKFEVSAPTLTDALGEMQTALSERDLDAPGWVA